MIHNVLKIYSGLVEKKKVKAHKIKKKEREQLGMVAHTLNPNTWETEADRYL